MNIATAIIVLAAGLAILCKAADLLVTAAVRLAAKLGVSPLVIGLTVVAMGTSAPEVAASIAAALRDAGDIAVGNVYGSNIANLALVGGLVAIIRPLETRKKTLQREIPVMLAAALLLWPVLSNLFLSRPESIFLLAVFVILIILTVYAARKEATTQNATDPKTDPRPTGNAVLKNVLLCLAGLVGLALGAKMTLANRPEQSRHRADNNRNRNFTAGTRNVRRRRTERPSRHLGRKPRRLKRIQHPARHRRSRRRPPISRGRKPLAHRLLGHDHSQRRFRLCRHRWPKNHRTAQRDAPGLRILHIHGLPRIHELPIGPGHIADPPPHGSGQTY
jgi:Ca2+/H+ antiporter